MHLTFLDTLLKEKEENRKKYVICHSGKRRDFSKCIIRQFGFNYGYFTAFSTWHFLMKCNSSTKFQRKNYDRIRVQVGNRINFHFCVSYKELLFAEMFYPLISYYYFPFFYSTLVFKHFTNLNF